MLILPCDNSKFQKYLPSLFNKLRLDQENLWKDFANSTDCEVKFPVSVEENLTEFQKVLVIQAVRPDRLNSALSSFVKKLMSNVIFPLLEKKYFSSGHQMWK